MVNFGSADRQVSLVQKFVYLHCQFNGNFVSVQKLVVFIRIIDLAVQKSKAEQKINYMSVYVCNMTLYMHLYE